MRIKDFTSSSLPIFRSIFVVTVIIMGLGSFSSDWTKDIKFKLSTYAIENAWDKTLISGVPSRPWSWIKSDAIAKITIRHLGKEHIILSDVLPATLTFAPGWHTGSDKLGDMGISLISAQKNTHFSYLKDLEFGQSIYLEMPNGEKKVYKVDAVQIVETPEIQIPNSDTTSTFILTTTYAFGNWHRENGGDMRLAVIASEYDATWNQDDLLALGKWLNLLKSKSLLLQGWNEANIL